MKGIHKARIETNSKNAFFVLWLPVLIGWLGIFTKEVVHVLGLRGVVCLAGFVCILFLLLVCLFVPRNKATSVKW